MTHPENQSVSMDAMTMRDFFAAFALLPLMKEHLEKPGLEYDLTDLSRDAYRVATYMIRAREEGV